MAPNGTSHEWTPHRTHPLGVTRRGESFRPYARAKDVDEFCRRLLGLTRRGRLALARLTIEPRDAKVRYDREQHAVPFVRTFDADKALDESGELYVGAHLKISEGAENLAARVSTSTTTRAGLRGRYMLVS